MHYKLDVASISHSEGSGDDFECLSLNSCTHDNGKASLVAVSDILKKRMNNVCGNASMNTAAAFTEEFQVLLISTRRIIMDTKLLRIILCAGVVAACSWNELVLSSDLPVLVEFWASWCGPCKMVSRLTDELAREYSERIQCFRIDTDDHPQVAASYGVERIPTILVFKNAQKLQTLTGTLPKSVYVAAIQKSLSQ